MGQWLPIPTWDGLHPIIIHFPIALLMAAPVFIFLGMILMRRGYGFLVAALILLLLGTAGTWVAMSTGQAAADLVERTPAISAVLTEHADLAAWTRLAFTILTLVFALLVGLPYIFKTVKPGLMIIAHCVFLVLFVGACLLLARTGHLGGQLVHAYGVRAMVDAGAEGASSLPEGALESSNAGSEVKTEDQATTHSMM
jgi:uncharacterized membrane protein